MDAVRSRSDLLSYLEKSPMPEMLFFWGHRKRADGQLTKTCMSQWYEAPFDVDGVRYATAEHYMMAEKARLFGDDEVLAEILKAPDPGQAKKLGRKVRGFDATRWEAARFDIVVRGNTAKFSQNSALRSFLVATGERLLVEASPHDRIWGIGMSEADPRAADPREWDGDNLLGFALMHARRALTM